MELWNFFNGKPKAAFTAIVYGQIITHHNFLLCVITIPCPNFNSGLIETPLTLGHGWLVTSQRKLWNVIIHPWTLPVVCESVIEGIGLMLTSSNGTIFRVTGPLCGEFTGPGEFPAQRLVTRNFGVFFDLRLNKRLSKQPWDWWFETPSWPLWRHCNARIAQHCQGLRRHTRE